MKIGIIGAGAIAQVMATTIQGMKDAEGYAIASRDLEKAEKFAKKNGFQKAYGSYEELVNDKNIELIYIATPHSHHFAHAKLCIDHGIPVLCEKAFMANAKQAEEIFSYAKEKNVFITEAIWTRYMPSKKIIQEIISSGEIGEVVALTANLGYDMRDKERLLKPELAGGALLDVGVYTLHFASMFLGNEVEKMVSSCVKTETGVDAWNAVILKYKNGVLATLHSGMLADTEQCGIIYGTKGMIIADFINNVKGIKVYGKNRELKREIEIPKQITGYEYEVISAMTAIKNGEKACVEITHKETMFIMEQMDALRAEWGIKYPFE